MGAYDKKGIGWQGPFIFRYTGRINWKQMYREGREFWMRRASSPYEFIEKRYSHKPGKLVVGWEIGHNYDAYYKIEYKLKFRLLNPKTVVVTENGQRVEYIDTAMYCYIWFKWKEEYEEHSPAGHPQVFQNEWLRNIYRKITWRERWDLIDDIALFTCNDYMEVLKKQTQMGSGGYATIWEQG